MEYEGLSQDDLDNVRALNRVWLELEGSAELRRSAGRLERLAATPFMLFSFCEHDDARWSRLFGERRQQDMLEQEAVISAELRALQVAGLAYLWELTRRNPYVARIVSGAPLQWCEQIAASTLVRVLECARFRLIEPRFADETELKRRLLGRGSALGRELRVFAQIAALQAMLTGGQAAQYRRLPAAACRMPQTKRQVADEV
jgi:hypothetical protein